MKKEVAKTPDELVLELRSFHHYEAARLLASFLRDRVVAGEKIAALEAETKTLKEENGKLKQSVFDWKEAWFGLREVVGDMWWKFRAEWAGNR